MQPGPPTEEVDPLSQPPEETPPEIEAPTADDVEQDEPVDEGLFIPAGAKLDTPITQDLTVKDLCQAFNVQPTDQAWRELREIMGTAALPEMDATTYMYYNEYVELWENEPPEGYIEAKMGEGLNLQEFIDAEKQKPSWSNSPAYQKLTEENTAALADFMENGDNSGEPV